MTNQEIADLLSRFADLLDIKGESGFRVSAYRRGAETIKRLPTPVAELAESGTLTDIQGIGKGIAANIADILTHGRFPDLGELQDEIPATLATMLAIPGLGPKTVGRLYRELGLTNLDDLELAAQNGIVSTLKRIGAKQEQQIIEGIAFLRQRSGRLSIGKALPTARYISQRIEESLGARAAIAGSVRRMTETVGNIDLIASAPTSDQLTELLAAEFRATELEVTDNSVTADLPGLCSIRIVISSTERWGTDWVRLTGSDAHIASLTELNDLALAENETRLYEHVDLPWIPPELREGRGEIEAARGGKLPNLVDLSGIMGDLHLHSNWSDGRASIQELATRAEELGYAYLSIADHSHSLAIARGLNEERLSAQADEIADVQEGLSNLKLLRSSEVEIRRDGSLDFPDEVLAKLDLVVASLHSGRSMTEQELTDRLLRAIENPHVDIIAHPTGRIVEQRAPATYDWDRVFEAAIRTGTALEINANPARLDLPEELARQAFEAGVLIAIDSDAHDLAGLDVMEFGVGIARRGWVPADSVINTWNLSRLLEWSGR